MILVSLGFSWLYCLSDVVPSICGPLPLDEELSPPLGGGHLCFLLIFVFGCIFLHEPGEGFTNDLFECGMRSSCDTSLFRKSQIA